MPSPLTDTLQCVSRSDRDRPLWSIVLPVHNQADHVARVVESYVTALEQSHEPYAIHLVPNACRDESPAICVRLSQRYQAVNVHPIADGGWGRAVREGLSHATGDFVCYTNLARTSATDLMSVLTVAHASPEQVCKAVRSGRDDWRRRLGSRLYNAQARALFAVAVRDINATPKVFPRRYAPLLELTRNDDLIDLEFVATCARHGYPIREVLIQDSQRHGGTSTTDWRTALHLYTGAFAVRSGLRRA
jgi:hypothetical protein